MVNYVGIKRPGQTVTVSHDIPLQGIEGHGLLYFTAFHTRRYSSAVSVVKAGPMSSVMWYFFLGT